MRAGPSVRGGHSAGDEHSAAMREFAPESVRPESAGVRPERQRAQRRGSMTADLMPERLPLLLQSCGEWSLLH